MRGWWRHLSGPSRLARAFAVGATLLMLLVVADSTVAKIARPEKNARLAVEANIAMGGAARRNGDWETSARAYSQASYIADTIGDRQGILTVQVGIANTYMAKGNLPQAQSILDDVIVQSADERMLEIQGTALHSRSALAQSVATTQSNFIPFSGGCIRFFGSRNASFVGIGSWFQTVTVFPAFCSARASPSWPGRRASRWRGRTWISSSGPRVSRPAGSP